LAQVVPFSIIKVQPSGSLLVYQKQLGIGMAIGLALVPEDHPYVTPTQAILQGLGIGAISACVAALVRWISSTKRRREQKKIPQAADQTTSIISKAKDSKNHLTEIEDWLGLALTTMEPQLKLEYCEKYLDLHPEDADGWIYKGHILGYLGRLNEATDSIRTAFDLASLPDSYMQAVAIGFDNEDAATSSINLLNEALAENPKLVGAWLHKGQALCRLQKWEDALACFDQALTLVGRTNSAEVWCERARPLLGLDKCEETIASLDKSLNADVGYADAWALKGWVLLYVMKEPKEAVKCLDNALMILAQTADTARVEELNRYKEVAIAMQNESSATVQRVAWWFAGNPIATYAVAAFIWNFCIFGAMGIWASTQDKTIGILSVFGFSAIVAFGGALYMLILRSDFITQLDEKWRRAITEDRLPGWVGIIRLSIVVLPYWIYGWVPEKVTDWYLRKYAVGESLAEVSEVEAAESQKGD